jgi:hypothetical protein
MPATTAPAITTPPPVPGACTPPQSDRDDFQRASPAQIAARYHHLMDCDPQAPQRARRKATLHQLSAEFRITPRVAYYAVQLGTVILEHHRRFGSSIPAILSQITRQRNAGSHEPADFN